MKKMLGLFFCCIMMIQADAQTGMKSYTVGDPFIISLPAYMSRATGVNENAVFEFKNDDKGVYGFVIEDNKEVMQLAEISFASISEFYTEFVKGFVEGETKVTQSKPISQKKGDLNIIEADLSYYDQGAKTEIYYLVGIVETKNAFYKVMSYCALEDKAKFKEDFKKILYSFKD